MKKLLDERATRVYVTAGALVASALAIYALAAPFDSSH